MTHPTNPEIEALIEGLKLAITTRNDLTVAGKYLFMNLVEQIPRAVADRESKLREEIEVRLKQVLELNQMYEREHENFLVVHRDNMGLLEMVRDLKENLGRAVKFLGVPLEYDYCDKKWDKDVRDFIKSIGGGK